MADDDQVRNAAEAVNTAQAFLITAGAGMGVDSGLPDFRGKKDSEGVSDHCETWSFVPSDG